MQRFSWILFLAGSIFMTVLLFTSACRGGQQTSQPAATGEPPYAPVATIKDIMDAMVDPSADVVWNSVATIANAQGIVDKAPKTPEEWADVRRGALRVVEGANLLMMPGRHVARPGEKSETPGVELEPEVIEANINKDRAKFNKLAIGLQEATREALKAIEAKDTEGVVNAGEKMDTACENCHTTYWYPNQPLPPGYQQ